LSLEAAQLLRHLNLQLPKNDEESDRIRNEYLKRAVMPQLNLKPGTRIHLPRRARSLIESWNDAENDLLKAHATRIHGDVEDLTLSPEDADDERKPHGANSVARLAAAQIAELLR
jgi:hypothetical protein